MLKEPWAHDVGGMFRQNPPLIFGLFVFAVQQGRKVQVYLETKTQDRQEGEKEWISWFGYCYHGNKERLTITNLFSFPGGKGRNTLSRVTMVTKFEYCYFKKEGLLTTELHKRSADWWTDEEVPKWRTAQKFGSGLVKCCRQQWLILWFALILASLNSLWMLYFFFFDHDLIFPRQTWCNKHYKQRFRIVLPASSGSEWFPAAAPALTLGLVMSPWQPAGTGSHLRG